MQCSVSEVQGPNSLLDVYFMPSSLVRCVSVPVIIGCLHMAILLRTPKFHVDCLFNIKEIFPVVLLDVFSMSGALLKGSVQRKLRWI
jgi:hypothetical protein